jgi:hypothetical protein
MFLKYEAVAVMIALLYQIPLSAVISQSLNEKGF